MPKSPGTLAERRRSFMASRIDVSDRQKVSALPLRMMYGKSVLGCTVLGQIFAHRIRRA
jgi:hypothetical protein